MANKLALKSFRLKNFKAIKDSDTVKFKPLTVLIGDNGSGKSSLVEGLRTYQTIVTDGLDAAMNEWRGFEHIRYGRTTSLENNNGGQKTRNTEPIEFRASHAITSSELMRSKRAVSSLSHRLSVSSSADEHDVFICEESVKIGRKIAATRNAAGDSFDGDGNPIEGALSLQRTLPGIIDARRIPPGISLIKDIALNDMPSNWVAGWQFLTLNPESMRYPRTLSRSRRNLRLRADGSNIAEYLNDILGISPGAYTGIVEAIQFVLPYMRDLKPVQTEVHGRHIHLEMYEDDFRVPGWLLSTGTLRIIALLAVFRHPKPPPLIVIEELENGLDPRVIHLIVEEIRNVVESGRSQVIVTTHSTDLLNLLPLWSIVLVERTDEMGPAFNRPDDNPALEKWAEQFGTGELYTMQRLRNGRST